jgi:hypothetical protein
LDYSTTIQPKAEGKDLLTSLDLCSHSYVTASLGSITDTLDYKGDFTHVDSPVEDRDVGKLRTISKEALRLIRGLNFGWKAFWDSNRE